MRLVITLPLPPAELSPNARVHWGAKARKTKKYREDACLAATDARNRASMKKPLKQATVKATFYFKDARRRDRDNAIASIKGGVDGIADAGIVRNDADFTYLPVEFKTDKADPRLELVIEGE